MAIREFKKINDLSNSKFLKSHMDQEYKPASNVAVGMGRVSIKKNKDTGNSDLAQVEAIGDYVEAKGFTLAREIWDVAETGHKHEQRKNFKAMLDFVRQHPEVKHIIFSHQSRSNRNRESAKELEMLIKHQGVTVHCVRDGLVLHDRSPLEDWLRWDIFNSLNEKFSKDHKLNVLSGMKKRIEMGLAPCLAPFGYLNKRLDELDELSIFVVVEDEARYVREMYEMFATGRYSIKALRAELDRLHPSMKGRLNLKRFGDILRNPFYYGWFRVKGELYEGHPEYHPRLIRKDLFDRVQRVLDQPHRSKRKVTKREHPYLGLLKCGGRILDDMGNETDEVCGCSVTAEEKRKRLSDGTIKTYVYYHCGSVRRCSQQDRRYLADRGLRAYLTEDQVERSLETILDPLTFTPDVVKWMQTHLLQEHHEKSGDHRQASAALLARRTMLQQYVDRAYEDKLRGDLTEEVWREKNAKWKAELADVLEQIKHLDARKDDYIQRGVELIELVHDLKNTYKSSSPNKKRRIVEVVSSNHVLIDGTLRFDYRKPFDLLAASHPKEKWWT